MTQVEISKYLEIPLTTLNDWKKEDSNRNKLYQLLIHLDKKELQNISEKKLHIDSSIYLIEILMNISNLHIVTLKKHLIKVSMMMQVVKSKVFIQSFLKNYRLMSLKSLLLHLIFQKEMLRIYISQVLLEV